MKRSPGVRRRRGGGWAHIGDIRTDRRDAPAVARRLALHRAWRDVAGATLAARLPVLERRGPCLVLAVPHTTWLASLPAIEARVATALAAHPDLPGIRKLAGRLATVAPAIPAPAALPRVAVAGSSEAGADVQTRWAALAARLLDQMEP